MSGRQKVDTMGVVPDEESHCQGWVDMKQELLRSGGCRPPSDYPLSIWHHHTWPDLPYDPPPYLHTASWSKTGGGYDLGM